MTSSATRCINSVCKDNICRSCKGKYIKNGWTRGKQRYRCKDCNKSYLLRYQRLAYKKETDSSICAQDGTLSFSSNATSDIVRAANALNLTNEGKVQLKKIDQSEIKVKIKISSDAKISKLRNGKSVYTYGETVQGNFNEKDNYGRKVNTDGTYSIKEATITIYEGTIKEGIKENSGLKHEGLTLEQAVGAVVGHEGIHATDKDEIDKDLKAEMEGGMNEEREHKPNEVEQKIITQSKNQNE